MEYEASSIREGGGKNGGNHRKNEKKAWNAKGQQ